MEEHSGSNTLPLLQPLLYTEYGAQSLASVSQLEVHTSAGATTSAPRDLTHVQFVSGNPQLEVRAGVVVLAEPISREYRCVDDLISTAPEDIAWDTLARREGQPIDRLAAQGSQVDSAAGAPSSDKTQFLCILLIRSHMIPQELVHFLYPNIHNIRMLRILRHYTEPNKYLAVIETTNDEAGKSLLSELHCVPFNGLEATRCLIYPCNELRSFGKEPSDKSEELARQDSTTSSRPEAEVVCPVCLDLISADSSGAFVTNCNHTFHLDCVRKLEGPQCPVCRFQHDSGTEDLSECQVCHLKAESDLWVCLVCGFVACGGSLSHHIREHYAATLHTYAMNTDTHQVWDFAGDGFVHRLIVEKRDPTEEEPNDGVARTKLVEVADPNSHSHERPQRPPMSDQVEELVIHSKLERVARRYNHVLSWQLEQQREQYQQELDSIHRHYDQNDQGRFSTKDGSQSSWGDQLIVSLRHERSKLRQKCDSALERVTAARKELQFLQDLNESLLRNRAEWVEQTNAADAELREAEEAYRQWVPSLERKVRELMLKLERSEAASLAATVTENSKQPETKQEA